MTMTDAPPESNLMIVRAVSPALEMRAADDGDIDRRPLLSGYFSRFDEWTEIDSWFEGHFMERIVPGAFRKTFRERKDQIRVMFQHGMDPEVGDKPIGEPVLMEERDEGAYHETRLFDGLPPLILDGLRAGQYGQSFRMEILREDFNTEPEPGDHNPKGLPERSIKEIRLHEFGPVTFPAYDNTTPEVRSLTDRFVFGWIERYPERARELVGAHDLSRAALGRSTDQQDAPDTPDAVHEDTSSAPRRDTGHSALAPKNERWKSALIV
jgi:HK97 family phage prohead protease